MRLTPVLAGSGTHRIRLARAPRIVGRIVPPPTGPVIIRAGWDVPLADAKVTTEWDEDPPFRATRTATWNVEADKDGWFRGHLPPGRHDIGIRIPRVRRPAGAQRVWIVPDEETRVVFEVTRFPAGRATTLR